MARTPSPAPERAEDAEVHPLGQVIVSVLEDGPGGQTILGDRGFDCVKRALDEYLDAGEALMAAVDTLLVAAHLLEVERGARAIAERLVTLVDRPEVIASMRQLTEAAEAQQAREVASSAERFSRFTDAPPSAATPVGASPSTAEPTGRGRQAKGLRLGDLAFPKRL